MKIVQRPGPLLLVPLVGFALLNCSEERPTEPKAQAVTTTAQTAEATGTAGENPTLSATDLLQDPALEVFVEALTVPNQAEKIRRAMDEVVTALVAGDDAAAHDHFADARKALADYSKSGELDPDDDIHLDVIDFFLDGVEEMLPEVDEGPRKGKKKERS